jgi:deazaflavin-dependent oxidoreductase (nitroreductase family)
MPWPRFLKPAHTIINPVALRRAGRAGSLAIVTHRGRRSGHTYRTPVRAFRRGGVVAIGANFGATSDWVRNILAADGCELRLRGELFRLTEPRLLSLGELPPVIPRWYRWTLRSVVRTHQCLVARATKQQQR